MPLIQSASKNAFQDNLKEEVASGKPSKQSLAIAYAIKRRNQKSHGGMIHGDTPIQHSKKDPRNMAKAIMMARGGMVNSEDALSDASDYEMGHEMHPEEAMDNESMPLDPDEPHEDFLSSEEDTASPSEEESDGLHDLDHARGQKSLLHKIMSGLHFEHLRK